MVSTVQKTVKKRCHDCNGHGKKKVPSRRGFTIITCRTCEGTKYIDKPV